MVRVYTRGRGESPLPDSASTMNESGMKVHLTTHPISGETLAGRRHTTPEGGHENKRAMRDRKSPQDTGALSGTWNDGRKEGAV